MNRSQHPLIVCAGLGTTGTSALDRALGTLGLRTAKWTHVTAQPENRHRASDIMQPLLDGRYVRGMFDEVDAGIGGAAAIEVGRRLARLARSSQVIAVTHLAQVAAFASNHLSVVKASDGSVTASSVRRLEGADREAEMARLLSGMPDSDAALTHARELLDLGAERD